MTKAKVDFADFIPAAFERAAELIENEETEPDAVRRGTLALILRSFSGGGQARPARAEEPEEDDEAKEPRRRGLGLRNRDGRVGYQPTPGSDPERLLNFYKEAGGPVAQTEAASKLKIPVASARGALSRLVAFGLPLEKSTGPRTGNAGKPPVFYEWKGPKE